MNNVKKVMLVFGTRPEAIKMAPIYHALKTLPDEFETLVCVTAQHREMLDQVLRVFEIIPDVDLDLMRSAQDLFDVTSSVLLGMREVLKIHQPDVLLVHGDTTTTFATSLAGFYAGVSVGHVEAGLRTHNLHSPFPEELNRQITTKVAKWHFAPTNTSRKNLENEQVPLANITVTGNTVIDALFWTLDRLDKDKGRHDLAVDRINQVLPFDWQRDRYILITGHRRENFGKGFFQICHALKEMAESYPSVHFVYPLHLNPNVRRPVKEILSGVSNVYLIDPLDYEPFLLLLRFCYFVLTDSGGIQEEAPSLGKPVLVMRDVTERPEAVVAKTVRLVGANRNLICDAVSELLDNEDIYNSMSHAHNPYGNGDACMRIIQALRSMH